VADVLSGLRAEDAEQWLMLTQSHKGNLTFLPMIRSAGSMASANVDLLKFVNCFSPQAFDDPKHFLELADQVSKKIKSDCPNFR
jgi:hypothetical protein